MCIYWNREHLPKASELLSLFCGTYQRFKGSFWGLCPPPPVLLITYLKKTVFFILVLRCHSKTVPLHSFRPFQNWTSLVGIQTTHFEETTEGIYPT